MLMTSESGNLAQVREATRGDVAVGDVVGYGDSNSLYAEMSRDVELRAYLLETTPGHENIAAGHLVGRRFPIYLPEMRYDGVAWVDEESGRMRVAPGDKLPRARLMFPGYVIVFAWLSDGDKNYHRLGVPGARRLMRKTGGELFRFNDGAIDDIRSIEAILNPIEIPQEWQQKRKRYGWRKKRRQAAEQEVKMLVAPQRWLNLGNDQWISAVDALRILDDNDATQSLGKALGLVS